MSTLAAVARAVAMTPVTILRSTQIKLSVLFAAVMGLIVGANSRAKGREPAGVIEKVRDEMITDSGRLVEQELRQPPTPFGRAVEQPVVHGNPFPTPPESWNRALEEVLIVPMIRSILALTEAAAGVGYWLAGFVPPLAIKALALGVILGSMVVYLGSLREVSD